MVTLYSTPQCAPCRVAEKRLELAGIPYNKVDLTTAPDTLADLKARLSVDLINTPTFEHDGVIHVGIQTLTPLIASIQADA